MEAFVRIRPSLIPAFVLIAALFVAAPVQAQNKIGVLGGVNFSSVSFDPSVDEAVQELGADTGEKRGKTGFGIGIAFERPITPKFNLRLHGLFNQTGLGFEASANVDVASTAGAFVRTNGTVNASFQQDITLNEFNIDVLANLPVGAAARFSINAGMFFAFLMSDKQTFKEVFGDDVDEGEITDDEDRADISSANAGIAVGAEYKITRKVILGALYRLGLMDRDSSDDEEALFNSAKTRALMIYVIFLFGGVS